MVLKNKVLLSRFGLAWFGLGPDSITLQVAADERPCHEVSGWRLSLKSQHREGVEQALAAGFGYIQRFSVRSKYTINRVAIPAISAITNQRPQNYWQSLAFYFDVTVKGLAGHTNNNPEDSREDPLACALCASAWQSSGYSGLCTPH